MLIDTIRNILSNYPYSLNIIDKDVYFKTHRQAYKYCLLNFQNNTFNKYDLSITDNIVFNHYNSQIIIKNSNLDNMTDFINKLQTTNKEIFKLVLGFSIHRKFDRLLNSKNGIKSQYVT
jgi:hypothetical protein